MFSEMPLLSLVIWLPIVGGAIVLAAANIAGNNVVRWLSLAFAALTFVVSLPLYTHFVAAATKRQFVERAPWIKAFNFNYHLGIDGISLLLILLTSFTTVLVLISAWEVIQYKVAQYMAAILIMEGLMIGVFAALDAALFYVLWEAMLIQMFIIIGVWGGAVILAAIMLKLGAYGFVRFMLPIAPDASAHLDWLVIGLSLIAVVYIALVALVQEDMKKLIAYSSIAHMGFVTLGFFLVFSIFEKTGSIQGAALGFEGAVVQLISHGFISGALFLCVGVMYDRLHSRNIGDYGGVVNTMPAFAALMVLFAMANAGLPGTSGFVGEFMVILSAFKANLWLGMRGLFGEVMNDGVATLMYFNGRVGLGLGSLAIVVLLLGVWPAPSTR